MRVTGLLFVILYLFSSVVGASSNCLKVYRLYGRVVVGSKFSTTIKQRAYDLSLRLDPSHPANISLSNEQLEMLIDAEAKGVQIVLSHTSRAYSPTAIEIDARYLDTPSIDTAEFQTAIAHAFHETAHAVRHNLQGQVLTAEEIFFREVDANLYGWGDAKKAFSETMKTYAREAQTLFSPKGGAYYEAYLREKKHFPRDPFDVFKWARKQGLGSQYCAKFQYLCSQFRSI